MLKLASARLDKLGIGWTMLTGEVPPDHRPALLDRFRADGALQVLLSSDAGGVGLNLQVANYVVHLDLPWNPARLDQRTARAHRLGQTRGVYVTYLCAESGIERGIEGTLAGKRAVRTAALDLTSDVDELETQTFTMFLRQLRAVMEDLAQPQPTGTPEERPDAPPPGPPQPSPPTPPDTTEREPKPSPTPNPTPAPNLEPNPDAQNLEPAPRQPHPAPSAQPRPRGRAQDRLRLAHIVLEAGFPADAIKAAYDALAAGISTLLEVDGPMPHEALVAALYRDLVPAGKLPMAVPGVLARLHDLGSLERMGVAVDPGLAKEVLDEVSAWVVRF